MRSTVAGPVATLAVALGAWLTLGACGELSGYSGAPADVRLAELSEDEMGSLCSWIIDHHGGENASYECAGGYSVRVQTHAECVAEQPLYRFCALTVRDMEDCVVASGDTPCPIPQIAACEPYITCLDRGE
ncbi:hypothetical protein [Haliangium ochraceum]|uniref:hypothetical protein n=1 Tax=Haliangium ochraceum TaxID=80816 RepID=UPI00019BA99C|nr:hypothetical protein [Haliangium ochraceum]